MAGRKLLHVRIGVITSSTALDKRVKAHVKDPALSAICSADIANFTKIASVPPTVTGKHPLTKQRRNQPVSIFLPRGWNLLMAIR